VVATREAEEIKATRVKDGIDRALERLPVVARGLAEDLGKIDFPSVVTGSGDPRASQQRLSADKLLEAAIQARLEQHVPKPGDAPGGEAAGLFQFGLGLAPGVHPTKRLFLSYHVREVGDHFRFYSFPRDDDPKEVDDYSQNKPEFQWFVQAQKLAAASADDNVPGDWVPLYRDPFTKAVLTEFSMPLVIGGEFKGAVFANYSAREMRALGQESDLGGIGYAMVLNCKEGELVVHPVGEHVAQKEKLNNIDPPLWARVQKRCQETTAAGEAADFERDRQLSQGYHARTTYGGLGWVAGDGRPEEFLFARLARGDLALVVVFDAHSKVALANDRVNLVTMIVSVVLLLIALCLLLIRPWGKPELPPTRWWAATALISLVSLAGIGATWTLTTVVSSAPAVANEPLVSPGRVNRALEKSFGIKRTRTCPISIPTGVFLTSLRFEDADTVQVSGVVWQKYHGKLPRGPMGPPDSVTGPSAPAKAQREHAAQSPALSPGDPPSDGPTAHPSADTAQIAENAKEADCNVTELKRGFLMPESVAFESNELYRFEQDGVETIGWQFNASLRQKFDYSTYPLDRKNIWVRFWHANFSDNVVLVPDLDAYSEIQPGRLPGIEKELVHTGWTLEHSFYSYIDATYNTNFGFPDYVGQSSFPELHFHAVLRRTFFSAFVKNLVPLLVAAIILFSVLLLITRQSGLSERFGFNTNSTMAACSGLFFTVLLAHIQLRDDLPVDGILYLEWFNFVMYVMILLVAVNAYMFSWDRPFRWIGDRDNLLPKLMFWPALLLTLFVITVASFYRV
jgi:drug/metabolite transporter (DMT)-like permease